MSETIVKVRGTITPEGDLRLSGRLPIGPGDVEVTLRLLPTIAEGSQDDLLTVLECIRAQREARGAQGRTRAEIDAELRALRDEWDERQIGIEALQERLRGEGQEPAC